MGGGVFARRIAVCGNMFPPQLVERRDEAQPVRGQRVRDVGGRSGKEDRANLLRQRAQCAEGYL